MNKKRKCLSDNWKYIIGAVFILLVIDLHGTVLYDNRHSNEMTVVKIDAKTDYIVVKMVGVDRMEYNDSWSVDVNRLKLKTTDQNRLEFGKTYHMEYQKMWKLWGLPETIVDYDDCHMVDANEDVNELVQDSITNYLGSFLICLITVLFVMLLMLFIPICDQWG